jgi:hypothetical protein
MAALEAAVDRLPEEPSMYPASPSRRNWAIGGVLLFLVSGTTPAAFAQKFARARSVAQDDADDKQSAPTTPVRKATPSRLIRPMTGGTTRTPIGSRPMFAPRVLNSPFAYTYPTATSAQATPAVASRSKRFVPGWQSVDGSHVATTGRGRVIRHVPGTPIDPQEGDIIYEEPDFVRGPSVSPTRKTTTVTVRQGGRKVNGEVIAPGRPTPAPGSGIVLESEGSEGPVIEGSIVQDGTVIEGEDGDVIYEDGGCGPDCDGCGSCSPYSNSQWGPKYFDDPTLHHTVPCDGICIPRHWIDETAVFLGVQGFTNPLDRGLPPALPSTNGNFGYHEGVNFAGHFGSLLGIGSWGLGYQVGATFLQSDLNGNTVNGLQTKNRDQQFFTAGLFRRAHDGYGLQGGFVYDYMHDNYWTKYSVAQLRVELSYLTFQGHEFGFWGAFSIHDGHDIVGGSPLGFQTIDMYNGFYRYTFSNGAQGRVWFGGTDNRQGIIGSDFRLPLSNNFDLWGWYNYLVPGNSGFVGLNNQGWNLTLNLVWYPGRKCCGIHNTPFRALFAPADNNWLITRPSSL